ncbi:MAG: DUF3135 domain-containing protein [Oxalobacteraceae bacterium]
MHLDIRLPDFDMLVSLHRDDPEAFESYRRHLLREVVDSAPPAQRPALELLLNQIEIARADAATPMDAAIIAFGMMQDSVNQLHNFWQQTQQAVAGLQTSLLINRVRR